ncbi:MAG TPA: hypothetical protein PKA20_25020 [Burkholderiaceae bacterium]|nr:hypothetical protein [Burkholderiaceae bacterium]
MEFLRFLLTRIWLGVCQLCVLLVAGLLIGAITDHLTGVKALGWLAGLAAAWAVNRALRVKDFHWTAY